MDNNRVYIIEGEPVPPITLDLYRGGQRLRPEQGKYRIDIKIYNPDDTVEAMHVGFEIVERAPTTLTAVKNERY